MKITSILFLTLVLLSGLSFFMGCKRSRTVVKGNIRALHSMPGHYGFYVAIWCGLPALLILGLWNAFETPMITHLVVSKLTESLHTLEEGRFNLIINDIKNIAAGIIVPQDADPLTLYAADRYRSLQSMAHTALTMMVLTISLVSGSAALYFIRAKQRARDRVEIIVKGFLFICACIAILSTIGIVLSVVFESIRFFKRVPVSDFLFGLKWSPQMAIRSEQVGGSGAFGAVPLFAGTLLISLIAMVVSVPVGLMSAIYLSEYASRSFRAIAKPLLEILAGIPTVVYGFFAAMVVAPFIRDVGSHFGYDVASESALAAGLVMGIMMIPFISSISDDVINAVPQSLRDGSYALGATQSETIQRVVIPAALPGIASGILLAVSRVIGETMIVVMAAGLAANLTSNPFEAVTTVTVQIVTLLTGDQEFDSTKTLAAFALCLCLFTLTLILNVIALFTVKRYREEYE